MTWRSKARGLAAASLLLLRVATAAGNEQSRVPSAAEALFRAGREAAERGEHELACARFRDSQRLDPALGTLLNIAICEERLGMVASAWQKFRHVARELSPGDPRGDLAAERARILEPRVPIVTLTLAPEAPPGTRVYLGNVEITAASLAQPLPLDPGGYTVRVTSEGLTTREYPMAVREGLRSELLLEPGAPLARRNVSFTPRPPPPRQTPAPGLTRPEPQPRISVVPVQRLGWWLTGIGAAGLAVSGVATLVMLEGDREAEAECDDRLCSAKGREAADRGRMASLIGTAAFTTGALALASGVYVLVYLTPALEARLDVSATAGANSPGLQLRYRF